MRHRRILHADLSGNQGFGEQQFKEEMDLLGKKHSLERMQKEREHAQTEEGRETLAVKGGFTSAASGSQIPDMKADCWSAESAAVCKEANEEVSPVAAEGMKVEEAATGKEASSRAAEGGFIFCEVEEQQARCVEAQPQKRRAVIRVKSGETKYYVMERRSCGRRILAKRRLRRSVLCQVR